MPMSRRTVFRPRRAPIPLLALRPSADIAVDDRLVRVSRLGAAEALAALGSRPVGLTEAEAAARRGQYGYNEMAAAHANDWVARLRHALLNPLVLLLSVLGVVSALTGDARSATVIGVMVALGVGLTFVQETRADAAASALKALVHVTSLVTRDGTPRAIPVREVVPGDIISLSAGDMLPADVRLLTAKDLFVGQSSLTGESLPVEKHADPPVTDGPPLECPTLCFRGTSVQSGSATAVVGATGAATYFGQMVGSLEEDEPPSQFQLGIDRFTWLMIRLIVVMAPLVFVINGLSKGDWKEAFFFSLAVAVGLTPEMLPMIFSVCLSKGAVVMSRKQVIVKHLDAIQSLGAIDVLCTDKTGTLTMDSVILERHCDANGQESERVLQLAYLVSHFQTGLKSALDDAILAHGLEQEFVQAQAWTKIDEVPFDFTRRLMSVAVHSPATGRVLVTKGAPEETLARCTAVEIDGVVVPTDDATLPGGRPAMHALLHAQYASLSREGFRVLAVASRPLPEQAAYGVADEQGLTLAGFCAFLDPPKESATPAIAALRANGVRVVILTGDNDLVTRRICSQVAVSTDDLRLGAEVETMDDDALADASAKSQVFARLTPGHKQRIIRALQRHGHVVGFLGDGINDAPALHTADVGLSVDTAVDIAKDSADAILLEKNLMVIVDAIREGRAVFANILKYIRMGASSNFGNMFSVIGASAWLPFVPMAPIQILTNNLLYDFSQVPIPTDAVDEDQLATPRPWSMPALRRYIMIVGPLSSIFDYSTFALLYFVLGANTVGQAALFHTGWFVESLLTQTLIIHVIRTNRLPFFQSLPSWPLAATTTAVVAVGLWLPVSPFAAALGLVPLPREFWLPLLATVGAYLLLTQGVKMWFVRKGWL